ncbi:TrmH family RNA methyltransferase [Rheinheimera baltica]|uniref:TrmH family RNA methyltransferase n=1 Tax=Rheinheimera baltica TaxID=67576 RepID=UPI000406761D|nr:RNA methyltransferase [Rheinheimera baltica]
MISQKWSKLIRSLQQKKYRKAEQLFFVEGEKAVLELLASTWQVEAVFGTEVFLQRYPLQLKTAALVQQCSADELVKVGTFTSNDAALAVVKMPPQTDFVAHSQGFVLVLDQINDPGNLGTIIRVADWYGIKHIVCSPDTTDCYNPKVIAAAKGSFLRVTLHYQPLAPLLTAATLPVFGAYLGGDSIHQLRLQHSGGYVVLGNEANGISAELESLIGRRITIPAFGGAESLNVGIATAIICDNLARLQTTQ